MLEVPLVGRKYTWYKSNGTTKVRLDRVLVPDEWFQKWPTCKQCIQPRDISDHCVIVVKSSIWDWGKILLGQSMLGFFRVALKSK